MPYHIKVPGIFRFTNKPKKRQLNTANANAGGIAADGLALSAAGWHFLIKTLPSHQWKIAGSV
jgi:hypothetical protein